MNYRHAYHAGNAADCMKHALLVWLMQALLRKPAPVFVLDTHAGLGTYDLKAEAERTGEWLAGIDRLMHQPPSALTAYVGMVQRLGLYPGSPALIRALLRADDRLVCCELHPEDHAVLRRWAGLHGVGAEARISVHLRDGYAALAALLPPTAKRGLVLIDSPFEVPGEFERLVQGLRTGAARWSPATYAAWYPIKHRSPVTTFHEGIRFAGLRDVVVAELWWRAPTDPTRLNGCGLLVRNPPYGFEAAAGPILAALLDRLGSGEAGEGRAVLRITDE